MREPSVAQLHDLFGRHFNQFLTVSTLAANLPRAMHHLHFADADWIAATPPPGHFHLWRSLLANCLSIVELAARAQIVPTDVFQTSILATASHGLTNVSDWLAAEGIVRREPLLQSALRRIHHPGLSNSVDDQQAASREQTWLFVSVKDAILDQIFNVRRERFVMQLLAEAHSPGGRGGSNGDQYWSDFLMFDRASLMALFIQSVQYTPESSDFLSESSSPDTYFVDFLAYLESLESISNLDSQMDYYVAAKPRRGSDPTTITRCMLAALVGFDAREELALSFLNFHLMPARWAISTLALGAGDAARASEVAASVEDDAQHSPQQFAVELCNIMSVQTDRLRSEIPKLALEYQRCARRVSAQLLSDKSS